jgi:hypothetical protein
VNILEQMRQFKLSKILQRLAGERIVVRKNGGNFKRKSLRFWCPHCQQWQLCRAGFACALCGHELPAKREQWEARKRS